MASVILLLAYGTKSQDSDSLKNLIIRIIKIGYLDPQVAHSTRVRKRVVWDHANTNETVLKLGYTGASVARFLEMTIK